MKRRGGVVINLVCVVTASAINNVSEALCIRSNNDGELSASVCSYNGVVTYGGNGVMTNSH